MSGSYRYTGTTWYRNGDVVEHGDEVDGLTDAEKAAFGDVLEPVTQTADDDVLDDVKEQINDVADANGDEPYVDESDGEATDDYECGAETSDGGTCSRDVDSPDERCWAHSED